MPPFLQTSGHSFENAVYANPTRHLIYDNHTRNVDAGFYLGRSVTVFASRIVPFVPASNQVQILLLPLSVTCLHLFTLNLPIS